MALAAVVALRSGRARPCWRSTGGSTAGTRSGTTCRSPRTSRRPARSPSCCFTDPLYLNWFYPQISELLHADGLLLFGNDFLSPLLNLGLARPRAVRRLVHRPPLRRRGARLAAVAAALASANLLFSRQPGNANNDVVAIALLLSTRRAPGQRPSRPPRAGALIVAGLAAGLALGTKLTVVPPVVALTIGVIAIAGSGDRLRAAASWIGGLAVGRRLWYVRNLIVSGNPFPLADIGRSFHAGGARRAAIPTRSSTTLTDTDVWGRFFTARAARSASATSGRYLLAAAVVGVVLWLWRGEPLERMLAAVALFAAVAYLLTPLGASGPEGSPVGFRLNVRYLAPGLALALVLFAIPPPLAGRRAPRLAHRGVRALRGPDRAERPPPGADRDGPARRRGSCSRPRWWACRSPPSCSPAPALPPVPLAAGVGVLVLALALAGRAVQDDYLDQRYSSRAPDYPRRRAAGGRAATRGSAPSTTGPGRPAG